MSFTVPIDEWMSIPDVDGKIHEIKPILDKFELTAECNNCSSAQRDTDYNLLAEDGRSATYKPRNLLGPTNGAQNGKEYKMKIVIKALEKGTMATKFGITQWANLERRKKSPSEQVHYPTPCPHIILERPNP